jgi:hypothetical protein
MPYKLQQVGRRWFVKDNAGIRLPSKKGFPTKEKARKQEIAVVLSQAKRTGKPVSSFFK